MPQERHPWLNHRTEPIFFITIVILFLLAGSTGFLMAPQQNSPHIEHISVVQAIRIADKPQLVHASTNMIFDNAILHHKVNYKILHTQSPKLVWEIIFTGSFFIVHNQVGACPLTVTSPCCPACPPGIFCPLPFPAAKTPGTSIQPILPIRPIDCKTEYYHTVDIYINAINGQWITYHHATLQNKTKFIP